MYAEGTKDVALGKVVAILVDKKEDIDKFKDFVAEGGADTKAPVAAKKETKEAPP